LAVRHEHDSSNGFVILSNAKDLLLAGTERKQVFRFAQDDNS
jgi:hypothetical protein